MHKTTPREDLRTLRHIIYRMLNTVTGMSYVGQSKRTFYQRYRGRWWNRANNCYIRRAVRKYGPETFYVEILESDVPVEALDAREIHWIQHFGSVAPAGYNLHTGGTQYRMSDPLRRKEAKRLRDACRKEHLLVKDGKEYRFTSIVGFANQMKLAKGMVGNVLKGKSRAHRGFHLPGTDMRWCRRTQRLRQLVKNGITYEFYNMSAFAREHDLSRDVIGQLFAGKVRFHHGFHIPDIAPLSPRKPMKPKIEVTLVHDNGEVLKVPNEHRLAFARQTGIDLYSLLCGRGGVSKGYRLQHRQPCEYE